MPRASQRAPRVSHPTRTLYISDPAYLELVRRARVHGDVKSSANIGMSKYLEWLLLHHDFRDTRPEDVRALDVDMLSAFVAPEWRLHSPRLARHVSLSYEALAKASVWATMLGMAYAPAKRIVGAPTFYDDVLCAAVLLEALGTGWVEAHHIDG
jgi:hypothetical protein